MRSILPLLALASLTITPGAAAQSPPRAPHPCDGTSIRTGPATGTAELLRQILAEALENRGVWVGPEVVQIKGNDPEAPLLTFAVPLGADRQPLPNRDCITALAAQGTIAPGSQQGGKYMLTGALQRAGGWSRITMRIVDVQTGAVLHTAKGQEAGTGLDGIVPAVRMAFDGLGFHFVQP